MKGSALSKLDAALGYRGFLPEQFDDAKCVAACDPRAQAIKLHHVAAGTNAFVEWREAQFVGKWRAVEVFRPGEQPRYALSAYLQGSHAYSGEQNLA